MNCILFDQLNREDLLPLTYTRPVSEIRIGILTITEKWNKYLNTECSFFTEEYLQEKYQLKESDENYYINGAVVPNIQVVESIDKLKDGQSLFINETLVAFKTAGKVEDIEKSTESFDRISSDLEALVIKYPWDIFVNNGSEIENDFKLITKGRTSEQLANTNKVIGGNIFVEKGVVADFATINARDSYIYLGKNSELMGGAIIRGSLALCSNSVLKLGAKIYGPTTIGPNSKVGGEVSNSVIFGNSNKAHDGYLGNSVLGEWCNLGADTNISNLKNNYAEVKLWNYKAKRFLKTRQQFCGLIMGDHSKCGINTMFNTGTVVGVNANIFGAGYPRNFVPSFSWGGAHGFTEYKTEKAFEVNQVVMKRRNVDFDEVEQKILMHIFNATKEFRR
jgi:UDP-N-acetylglucosamine diphosphorylase/glucosamine-1-phosphate N-acetyltransferase